VKAIIRKEIKNKFFTLIFKIEIKKLF